MKKIYTNPALQQEPIGKAATIIAPRDSESIFSWIQSTGRFKPYEPDKYNQSKPADEIEDFLEQQEQSDQEE